MENKEKTINKQQKNYGEKLRRKTTEKSLNEIIDNSLENKEKTTKKQQKNYGEKLRRKTTEKILCLIAKNPSITTEQLAEECGISSDGVDWQIRKLRKLGRLSREGSDRKGIWVIHLPEKK